MHRASCRGSVADHAQLWRFARHRRRHHHFERLFLCGNAHRRDKKCDAPSLPSFPQDNGLAAQLQQIAQIINVRQALGVSRQIFFCGIGNFDTHSDQLILQANLLSQIGPALAAFYQSTVDMGIANQITAFTMSDFARTFQPNSNTGTDHAWGSHHFVIGGAVKGGSMYGDLPDSRAGRPG